MWVASSARACAALTMAPSVVRLHPTLRPPPTETRAGARAAELQVLGNYMSARAGLCMVGAPARCRDGTRQGYARRRLPFSLPLESWSSLRPFFGIGRTRAARLGGRVPRLSLVTADAARAPGHRVVI
jgi:hypothetical protein